MQQLTTDEAREVRRVILKLNAQAWGTSFGMILGVGLFIATAARPPRWPPNGPMP